MLDLVADEKGGGGAEGGDLRHGDVDEDHLAREDMHTEIGVNAREHETHQERGPQDGDELGGHYRSAAASAFTL